jgi:hypothetical protein
VLDFDVETMERWVRDISPEVVYIGYDSRKNYLPEPEQSKVKVFMKRLEASTDVKAKTIRKAWWEN